MLEQQRRSPRPASRSRPPIKPSSSNRLSWRTSSRGRVGDGVEDALEVGPVGRRLEVLDHVGSTPRSARISSAPRDLLHLGLWYTSRRSHMSTRLPSTRSGDAERGTGGDHGRRARGKFLGRDDVNSVESILADDEHRLRRPRRTRPPSAATPSSRGTTSAPAPASRKLYEKAKTSQWNGSTDLDWSIDVDLEAVALEMAAGDRQSSSSGWRSSPGSPAEGVGPEGVDAVRRSRRSTGG